MNYFNIRLAISVILVLIVCNFTCDCMNPIANPLQINHIKVKIGEYVLNGSVIEDAEQVLKIKPERRGLAGTGSSGLVWICTLNITPKRKSKFMHKLKRRWSSQRNNLSMGSPAGSPAGSPIVSPIASPPPSPVIRSNEVIASQWNGKRIAVKFGINHEICKKELDIYYALKSNDNETTESYGIPTLYFSGVVMGDFPAFGITLCEESLDDRFLRPGTLTQLNLLCMLYQAMFSIKYIHGHKVLHQDIKPANFMVRRERLFLIDFNVAAMINDPRNNGGNLVTGSLSLLLEKKRYWMDDLKSLYYSIIQLAGVDLPWDDNDLTRETSIQHKLDYNAVRNLCMKINSNYTIARRVFLDFHDKVMLPTDPQDRNSVQEDKRIPLYDEIGEIILKGIEEIIEFRDVTFKWRPNERTSSDSRTTSSWIINEYKALIGAQLSHLE